MFCFSFVCVSLCLAEYFSQWMVASIYQYYMSSESESESESEPRPRLVLLLIALRIRLVRSQQVGRRRAGAERDNRQKRASLGVLVCWERERSLELIRGARGELWEIQAPSPPNAIAFGLGELSETELSWAKKKKKEIQKKFKNRVEFNTRTYTKIFHLFLFSFCVIFLLLLLFVILFCVRAS